MHNQEFSKPFLSLADLYISHLLDPLFSVREFKFISILFQFKTKFTFHQDLHQDHGQLSDCLLSFFFF